MRERHETTTSLGDAVWLIERLRPEKSHHVGETARRALANSIESSDAPDGQLLFEEGTIPPAVWAVKSGSVQLTTRLAGRRSLLLVLSSGDIVGDVPVLLRMPSLATAHVRDGGTMLRLPADRIVELLATHGDLSFLWMQNVAIRLDAARRRIVQLVGSELAQSIARLLLDEAVDGQIRLSQASLSEMLGAHRTSINRVLQTFRRAGIVELAYGRIAIADRSALEHLAMAGPRGDARASG
jgi:CRP-like cAMP-binding protein